MKTAPIARHAGSHPTNTHTNGYNTTNNNQTTKPDQATANNDGTFSFRDGSNVRDN